MGRSWRVPIIAGAAVAILVAGVAMMPLGDSLRWWVGGGLAVIGGSALLYLPLRSWWYVRHSYEFLDEAGRTSRVSFEEFGCWPEERKRWLFKNRREAYRYIERETSARMGPPGSPEARWVEETEAQFAWRLGAVRYLSVRLYALGAWVAGRRR